MPMCQVVLRYENGSSATNTLRYGTDMLDYEVNLREQPLQAPSGTNSMIAWVGGRFSETDKRPMRFCMTEFSNPHPDWTVATIDVIAGKTKAGPIIMAMTAGNAGLMK